MGQTEEVESRIGILQQGLIDNLLGGFPAVMVGLVKKYMELADDTWIASDKNAWNSTVDMWIDTGVCDEESGDILRKFESATGILGGLMRFIIRLQVIMGYIKSSTDVVSMSRLYDLMSKTTPNPAPAEALVSSMMIDPTRASENRLQMKRLGYDDTQTDNIILAHYRRVEEDTIRINYLRGNITSDLMYERMRELGYTDTRIKEIIQTWTLYPGPQDLFTMVAHEAFEPDIYTPMGLADEFPSDQVPWLEAQGISAEWAMKYWISHWNQPSLEQGFEMLHRGIITRDELDMLFRVVEIPKYWRDKLMQMTYNPYTRVDVRRMHELGVLTTEELVQSYQDLGYDATKAVKMAEFTLKYNAEGSKQLTRSIILTSFKEDLISRDDAMDLLKSQDYSEDVADFYLTHEEYKREIEVQKLQIGTLEDQYKMNMLDERETRSALGKMSLRGSKIDALLTQWTLEKYKSQALPSRTDIDDLLIQDIITEGEWRTVMTQRGYSPEHQSWILKLIEKYITVSETLPTKAEVKSWYQKELINADQYRSEMRLLGYADKYIDLYLKSM